MNSKIKTFLVLSLSMIISLPYTQVAIASDKPLLVTITTEGCYTCKKLKPILIELEEKYRDTITFLTLDLTSKSSIERAKQLVEENDIIGFFEENKASLPSVGIICPGGTKVDKVFIGEIRKEVYEEELDKLLNDTYTICSL